LEEVQSARSRFVPTRRTADGVGRGTIGGAAERLGALAPFALPGVTDLLLTGGRLWVDRGDGLHAADGWHRLPEDRVRELAVRLLAAGGRHLDDASPAGDARLPGGIRVHAVLPPVAVGGTAVSVRLPRREPPRLADLAGAGMVDPQQRATLERAMQERQNLLLTGASGTGKTTLLAALLAEVPATERIVVLEDVSELRIDHPHVVSLETRQANTEGAGGVTLDRLVREALRMRPDRLVIGECRGPEVRELLTALNTGHDGGAGTLHAGAAADVPARLEALGALAGMSADALARQAASALHLVVHLERTPAGRRVATIGRLVLRRGALEVEG
jgi:pilus assembly protein CpaF